MKSMHRLTPITPGELLHEEFLEPLGVSQYRLARRFMYLPLASAKLFRANVRSVPIQTYASAVSSA